MMQDLQQEANRRERSASFDGSGAPESSLDTLLTSSFHAQASNIERYQDSHLAVDLKYRTVGLDEEPVQLTRKQFDLLALLVRHAGKRIPRAAILMLVWGYGPGIRTRTLDVHIRRLRKKLDRGDHHYIETVFGIGYRFEPRSAPAPTGNASHSISVALGAPSATEEQRRCQ